jgi:hypothetical protein
VGKVVGEKDGALMGEVGALVDPEAVGVAVEGDRVLVGVAVGASVLGTKVIGAAVGALVLGAFVGEFVLGAKVLGDDVRGAEVTGLVVEGADVIGEAVVGAIVIGAFVVGAVGWFVGVCVTGTVGEVGDAVEGFKVGVFVGFFEGCWLGSLEGLEVDGAFVEGALVVGTPVGVRVMGVAVGALEGVDEGKDDGEEEGVEVGEGVIQQLHEVLQVSRPRWQTVRFFEQRNRMSTAVKPPTWVLERSKYFKFARFVRLARTPLKPERLTSNWVNAVRRPMAGRLPLRLPMSETTKERRPACKPTEFAIAEGREPEMKDKFLRVREVRVTNNAISVGIKAEAPAPASFAKLISE